jgi:serine/threonine protein phosphatase PrpC
MAINELIYTRGCRDPNLAHMGSTLTALILTGARGHIAHIGDTRAYRLRADRLEQLTHDHNLAMLGRPNVLYRALGTDTVVDVDYLECATMPHDRYLLCSDGVHAVLSDTTLATLLGQAGNLQTCAERIIEAALQADSQDNVTAVIVERAGTE